MKNKFEKQNQQFMHDNPENWKGIFYVNRKDSRILVPKRNAAMGWTLNFGNPYTYIGIGLIVIIITASQYLDKLF